MKKKNNGSLTLEAAIMVPIFVIIMLFANGLFVLFMGQQVMTHALVQSAKSLSFDPYASQKAAADSEDALAEFALDVSGSLNDGGKHASVEQWYEDASLIQSTVEERFMAYLKENNSQADELLESVGVKGGASGISFSDCSIADGVLTIKIKYTQDYIFNIADITSFERELSVKIKLFEYKTI